MATYAPRPITLTQASSLPAGSETPEPLLLVGTMPAGSVESADIVDSTTTGRAFITAANAVAAQTALGATTVGKAVIVATNAAAGRTAIGAGVPLIPGTAVADVTPASDGTAVGTAFNALLASLRANGVLAP